MSSGILCLRPEKLGTKKKMVSQSAIEPTGDVSTYRILCRRFDCRILVFLKHVYEIRSCRTGRESWVFAGHHLPLYAAWSFTVILLRLPSAPCPSFDSTNSNLSE